MKTSTLQFTETELNQINPEQIFVVMSIGDDDVYCENFLEYSKLSPEELEETKYVLEQTTGRLSNVSTFNILWDNRSRNGNNTEVYVIQDNRIYHLKVIDSV